MKSKSPHSQMLISRQFLFVSLLLSVIAIEITHAKPVSFAGGTVVSANGTDGIASSEAADFDNDGNLEFISTATSSTSDPHFRIYDFNGTDFDIIEILPDSEVESRPDRFGGDITTADINSDSWPDIIIPSSNNGNGGGSLSWFENPDGDLNGTWTEHVVSTWSGSGTGNVVAHMSEVDVADIDGDGLLDVVTRDISHGVYILLQANNSSGSGNDVTWQQRRFIPTLAREGLDLFNPDGDQDMDIILNGIWLETPDDPLVDDFVEHVYASDWYPNNNSAEAILDYATQIVVRDFNNDGRDDIAISNSEELDNASSTDSKPEGIRVYLAPANPKTQSWTEIILETQHFSWHSLEPADLDCDGDIDLVAGISTVGRDNAASQISYFLNNENGSSWEKVLIDTNTFVYNATLADADGDGDADLFAPNSFGSGPINYYENTSPIPEENGELRDFLVAHWTFDQQNTDVIAERTANLSGTSYTNDGQIGEALDFNSNNDRADVETFNIIGNQITLSCWVCPTSFDAEAAEARFISKASSISNLDNIWMLGNIDGNDLRFRLKTNGPTKTLTTTNSPLPLGQWSHIAASYDGEEMRIFLNGVQVANTTQTGNIANSSANIGLGNQPSSAGDRALIGQLDEVRIYRKALEPSEITEIMGGPIDDWAHTFGLPAGYPLLDDSDQDGLPFLLEYSFELDPTSQSVAPISFDGSLFSYPEPRTDITYESRYSRDLINWDARNPGGSKVFGRVEVTQKPR